MDPKDLVRNSYNDASCAYLKAQEPRAGEYAAWLDRLASRLPHGSEVLDLGCGAGLPVSRRLVSDGFRVTGVDISPAQTSAARKHVPGGTFVCGDMTKVVFDKGRFDAVVALYSVIHVPIGEQEALFRNISRWLVPGGQLLVTVGHEAWTGVEEDWLGVPGCTMYWSQADGSTYRRWLAALGFETVWSAFIPEEHSGHDLLLTRLGGPGK